MKDAYQTIRRRIAEAGIDLPDLEARIMLRYVLGVTDAALIAGDDIAMTPGQARTLDGFIARRAQGEPLSRILGEREFWGLPFRVTPEVLDPRPDTETIVEAALKHFAGRAPPGLILDLGTGSGCILIALLHEFREARGVGIDRSAGALAVAAGNARRNQVDSRARFIEGDWAAGLTESFDLIVSNPPYIPSADIPNLDREVRNHDPIPALDGGADGLEAYKIILRETKNLLRPGGITLLEMGAGQKADVARLAGNAGFSVIESIRDLGGHERVLKLAVGDSGEN